MLIMLIIMLIMLIMLIIMLIMLIMLIIIVIIIICIWGFGLMRDIFLKGSTHGRPFSSQCHINMSA